MKKKMAKYLKTISIKDKFINISNYKKISIVSSMIILLIISVTMCNKLNLFKSYYAGNIIAGKYNIGREDIEIITKDDLIKLVNDKIEYYNKICNGSCDDVIKNLNKFLKKLNDKNNVNDINNIYNSLCIYLDSIEIEYEESKEEDNTLNNNVDENSKFAKISELLNSQELNPILTGYEKFDKKIEEIINEQTNDSMTTFEKVKALYDYEINLMSYKMMPTDFKMVNKIIDETGLSNNDAMEVYKAKIALEKKKGTCEYYSALFMILTRRIGLESYTINVVTSKRVRHTTVQIKLGDTYYTFDPEGDDKSLVNGEIRYVFFGKTDKEIARIQTTQSRKSSINKFNNFKPVEGVLEANVTVGNVSTLARCLKVNSKINDNITNVTFVKGENNVPIIIDSNKEVNYYIDYGESNDIGFSENAVTGTITKGRVYISVSKPGINYLYVRLIDSNGSYIDYRFIINFIEYEKKINLDIEVSDLTDNELTIKAITKNGIFPYHSLACKIIDTDDKENNASCELIDENKGIMQYKIKNIKKQNKYTIEVTVVDNFGQIVSNKYIKKSN